MKLITTKIQTPLEDKALKLFDAEFSQGEQGLVLFPEGSINEQDLDELFRLTNQYHINIAGTLQENNYQKSVVLSNNMLHIGPISFPGQFIPNVDVNNPWKSIAHNTPLRQFYEEDKTLNVHIENSNLNLLIRICSDISLPYLREDKSDLFLIPSAIEHPADWFKHNTYNFEKNLNPDAKIMYSPSKTNNKFVNQPIGIYNINFDQLGEEKENYVVLDSKKQ